VIFQLLCAQLQVAAGERGNFRKTNRRLRTRHKKDVEAGEDGHTSGRRDRISSPARGGTAFITLSFITLAWITRMNGPAMLRTFLVFFVGGLAVAVAVISLVLSGGMIWMDCFHDNPGHFCGDAIFFAVATPFYGLVLALFVAFVPLLAGAVLAVLGRAFFRRVPLWYVIALLPVCVLAYRAQGAPWFPYDTVRPIPERLWLFSAFQAVALLICWRLDRQK
jgi:hypothetical protein